MFVDKINARMEKAHGRIVDEWVEVQFDREAGTTYRVTMVKHADGFRRVFAVTEE